MEASSSLATIEWIRGAVIAEGIHGTVFLGMDSNSGQLFAAKQVVTLDINMAKVQAIRREHNILKDLDHHENIVSYCGFEEKPELLTLFTGYAAGSDIGRLLLKYGAFEDQLSKNFVRQTLAGLEFLHSRGIIHGNLSCSNILVDSSGVCQLAGFSLARRDDESDSVVGDSVLDSTVFWTAPEVLVHGVINYKSDIWSLGCVTLELWSGKRPWHGQDPAEVKAQLGQSCTPPTLTDIVLSAEADDFIHRCFALDPSQRPTAVELQAHAYMSPGEVIHQAEPLTESETHVRGNDIQAPVTESLPGSE